MVVPGGWAGSLSIWNSTISFARDLVHPRPVRADAMSAAKDGELDSEGDDLLLQTDRM